ncbi:AbrB family transcriptional regulator [Corynebacterium diphtheriae]|uniref:AbrB family transcriptional regulator n=1 Tax=Corynebacterium diphtheriae TaxID=1717 RepID=UPI0002468021|nr:AbrB family transcriptional regulator [Corynebacterium diphtheriae]MBG9275147.1 AbrB family transcriptional regulator [Corynebacterium diphtheriae bv. mitis]MBG9292088.1 AbrB family transcriptional regulator [Corynebacterium diphtheriae bv. gravis]AEX75627.1 putative membrane protein [Corynebacterium diphtheriae HC02]AEX77828.1 putative membrane protein [Corynebacterium diphtheriae HC03]RKW97382.1 AbrB family transcriptional regulator [Corynebacterium diphtheriae]
MAWNSSLAAKWLLVVPASVATGYVFSMLHVPAAWILGAIFVSATMAIVSGTELPIHKEVFNLGRGFIGILAGLPLATANPALLARYVLPGLMVTFVTLAIGIVGGMVLARAQPLISQETGILSMLAGGASVMPVLAQDLGADFRYVALSQYLRLVAVSMSLPLVAHMIAPTGLDHVVTPRGDQPWWALALVCVIAVVGRRLAAVLRIPVPSILGPLLLIVAASAVLPHVDFTPPMVVRIFAFLCIGWMCGGGLSVAALKFFARQVPATMIFIVVLLGGCALTAWPLAATMGVDYFDAYLATSPGGLETVLALASEGGAGPIVVAVQIIRLLCVLLLAGWLPQLIRLLRRG